ncbi:methylamine utilization protein [Mangrovimicrobium sediminis]|uniref:methylamine utilization protein n=1 Tax=Mangrovimicrobium sediminis TaxID=2562682 RepID=UPI001436C7D4|nr:methylamine utilization protein [Haliea sp. SAOS-164]
MTKIAPWLGLLLLLASRGLGAQTQFLVTDQRGQPLADAVVELGLAGAGPASPDGVFVMDQVDKTFVPRVLVVPRGAAVSFPNSDDIRHHVYSFSRANVFEIKLYAGQPKAPVAFPQPGVVVLGCNIHDAMVGYIYVADSPYTAITGADGRASFSELPGAVTSIAVWHPELAAGPDARVELAPAGDAPDEVVEVRLDTTEPSPRDTFEDLFRHAD